MNELARARARRTSGRGTGRDHEHRPAMPVARRHTRDAEAEIDRRAFEPDRGSTLQAPRAEGQVHASEPRHARASSLGRLREALVADRQRVGGGETRPGAGCSANESAAEELEAIAVTLPSLPQPPGPSTWTGCTGKQKNDDPFPSWPSASEPRASTGAVCRQREAVVGAGGDRSDAAEGPGALRAANEHGRVAVRGRAVARLTELVGPPGHHRRATASAASRSVQMGRARVPRHLAVCGPIIRRGPWPFPWRPSVARTRPTRRHSCAASHPRPRSCGSRAHPAGRGRGRRAAASPQTP